MDAAKAAKDKYNKILKVVEPSCIPDADATGNLELMAKYGAIGISSATDL